MASDDLELAEQTATLGSFIGPLKDMGFACELLEASAELEMPTLVVGLETDEQGRDRWLSVNVVPLELADSVGLSVAQVYAPLPFALEEERRPEFGLFALTANQMLPLGSMGARDDGEIYFRYMAAGPDTTSLDPGLLARVAVVFQFQMDVFGEAMEQVVTGESSAADAIAALETGE